jgi:hypothetical protein
MMDVSGAPDAQDVALLEERVEKAERAENDAREAYLGGATFERYMTLDMAVRMTAAARLALHMARKKVAA